MEILSAIICSIVIYVVYAMCDFLYRFIRIGNVSNKNVFVTGCDSGFGNELAKQLDKQGVRVFAGCFTSEGEAELKENCSSKLMTIQIDVSDPKSVRNAYKIVSEEVSSDGLWGLVNNAGVAPKQGVIEAATIDDYKQIMDVNLFGVIDTTITFLPLVKKSKGRIVNMASLAGRLSTLFIAPYSVSKCGVESFSDCLRQQMNPFGVKVQIIEPGFHPTNMTKVEAVTKKLVHGWNQTPEDIKQQYGKDYFDAMFKVITDLYTKCRSMNSNQEVIDAYKHALFGRYPRARYVVGKDARYIWQNVVLLPEWMSDWILEKALMGIPAPLITRSKHDSKYD